MDTNLFELKGDYAGSYFPSQQADLLKTLVLKGPFNIVGGVFAHYLKNIGTGVVKGPVMATAEITLEGSETKRNPLRFLAGINATQSISVVDSGKNPTNSVVSNIENAGIVINGDVISNYIKLDNTIVFGNIRAKQITLTNSIVVGSIFAEEKLHIENSVFGTFSTGSLKFIGRNGCWLPYGTSMNNIEFLPSEKHEIPSELYYLALTKSVESNGISFWERMNDERAKIYPTDIILVNTANGDEIYALNIAKRVLNLALIESEINKTKEFLNELLIFEHLDVSSQEEAQSKWNEKYSKEENYLLELALTN